MSEEPTIEKKLQDLVAKWRKEGSLPSQAHWADSKLRAANELEAALAAATPGPSGTTAEEAARICMTCGLSTDRATADSATQQEVARMFTAKEVMDMFGPWAKLLGKQESQINELLAAQPTPRSKLE